MIYAQKPSARLQLSTFMGRMSTNMHRVLLWLVAFSAIFVKNRQFVLLFARLVLIFEQKQLYMVTFCIATLLKLLEYSQKMAKSKLK